MRASQRWMWSLLALLWSIPAGGCLSVSPGELVPVTPAEGDDDATPGDDDTTPGDDDTPDGDDDTPDGDDDTPPGDDDTPDGDDDTAPGDDDTAPGDDDDSITPLPTPTTPPDADGDGSPDVLDCDDRDPSVSPLQLELCNGRDDDCDGEIDEDFTGAWYPDRDGDGYGDSSSDPALCPSAGSVTNHDDCDDGDPAVFPLLVDAAYQGSSPDGSSDAPFPAIQPAIEAHRLEPAGCALILVRGGLYDEKVVLEGVFAVTIRATDGPTGTFIQPSGSGSRPLRFTGSGKVTVEGFTLTARGGSVSGHGGGVLIDDSDQITLRGLVIRDNNVSGSTSIGGGIAVLRSVARLEALELVNNRASSGGGLGLDAGAEVLVTGSLLQDNHASSGGGAGISAWEGTGSRLFIRDSSLIQNEASIAGGGAYAYAMAAAQLSLERTRVQGNRAGEVGGGVYNPTFVLHSVFQENTAINLYGGGVACFITTTLKNSLFLGNTAPLGGGAVAISYLFGTDGKSKRLENLTLVDNLAEDGSGIYLWDWGSSNTISVVNTIASGGSGSGLYLESGSAAKLELRNNNIHGQAGGTVGGELEAGEVIGINGNLSAPPLFERYNPPGFAGADFHLQSGSPSRDTGWSEVGSDPDGSAPDMGAYGGPQGAW